LRFPEFEGEWVESKIGEIVSIKSDKYNPETDELEYPCVELESLSQSTGELLSTFNSKNQKSIKNVFNPGDVLFGKLRPYLRKYYQADFEGVCSSEIWVMKSTVLNPLYLYAFVQSNIFQELTEISSGSRMPRGDWDLISATVINYPCEISEGEKIGKLFQVINARISTQNKIIEGLAVLKAALSKNIFYQQLRFPEFKEKWIEMRLGEVCEIVGGGTPDTNKSEYWNGNIQWFTPTEIKANSVSKSERTITKLGLKNSSAKILPKGAILLTTRATIGEASIALEECTTNQGFQSLVVKGGFDNIFIFNWIKENKYELVKRANGSTFPEISKSEIEKIGIPTPTLSEQDKIAQFLSAIDRKIELEIVILSLFTKQKRYLLQQMLV